MSKKTPAHDQHFVHGYWLHYPDHFPREDDPHYKDFHHFHRKHRATARCFVGEKLGFQFCLDAHGKPAAPPEGGGEQPGLELHHTHVEFAFQNAIDLKALEKDYPGVSNPDEVGAWVESGENFRWLCAYHHRGQSGAHMLSHSDWEGSQYVPGMVVEHSEKTESED